MFFWDERHRKANCAKAKRGDMISWASPRRCVPHFYISRANRKILLKRSHFEENATKVTSRLCRFFFNCDLRYISLRKLASKMLNTTTTNLNRISTASNSGDKRACHINLIYSKRQSFRLNPFSFVHNQILCFQIVEGRTQFQLNNLKSISTRWKMQFRKWPAVKKRKLYFKPHKHIQNCRLVLLLWRRSPLALKNGRTD